MRVRLATAVVMRGFKFQQCRAWMLGLLMMVMMVMMVTVEFGAARAEPASIGVTRSAFVIATSADNSAAAQPATAAAVAQQREGAAALAPLRADSPSAVTDDDAGRLFWNVTWIRLTGVALAVLGCVLLALAWQNPHEIYFGYFGGAMVGWALLSQRLWLGGVAWPHPATDYAFSIGVATVVGFAVQFLLSYAGLRSRPIETTLVAQWLLLPASLLLGGKAHLFALASLWYLLFALELFAVAALYLRVTWHERRHDFWPMAGVLVAAAVLALVELGAQQGVYAQLPFALAFDPPLGVSLALPFALPLPLPPSPLPALMPLLLTVVASRLFLLFARALQTSEARRSALARRVRELTTEFEGNFSQLAELRVEQVTERERKRIAADLHDDLGAKLLTIVHTSESERITALAREALEDMRLSVKGLIGKPMRLADALADWRAETVARLSQSKIEADWRGPTEETDHLLPSRGFVQTTRILREAVSNIVKHSHATRCKVRCRIADGQFAITIRDNGRGIPIALDGQLDRGLGMSSMKRRAKQMHGQCLVQSGPNQGTVIALTVPL